MSSSKLLTEVPVTVNNQIGNRGFAFFSTADHGDIFFHATDLADNGFHYDDLVVGCSAVIDIEVKATGKRRTAKIHEINCRSGRLSSAPKSAKKRSKFEQTKPAFAPGERSHGKIKVLKSGFGFLEESNHDDLFFPLSLVEQSLIPCLEEGINVRFEVQRCERGVMARVTDIIWPKSRMIHRLVEKARNKELYIYRVTFPSGQKSLEIRDGASVSESRVVARPITLAEARNWIEHGATLYVV